MSRAYRTFFGFRREPFAADLSFKDILETGTGRDVEIQVRACCYAYIAAPDPVKHAEPRHQSGQDQHQKKHNNDNPSHPVIKYTDSMITKP